MIKQIFMTVQGVLKAFWNATVKTSVGLIAVYLLAGLIRGMNIDASKITDLLSMSIILIKYWVIFWIVFFVRDLYFGLRHEMNNKW